MFYLAGASIILLLGFVVPAILFLLAQYNTLKLISPANRTIPPGLIWVQLIPFVNLIVQFIVVSGISQSLAKESTGEEDDSLLGRLPIALSGDGEKPTYRIGIAYCSLFAISTLSSLVARSIYVTINYLSPIASLAAMICWIIYWVELVKYKKKLEVARGF